MRKLSTKTSLKTVKNELLPPERYLNQPYARILIPDPKGGFSAEMLEFPGCFAEGDTADDAIGNLEKAASSWIEVALSQGQEIPPPTASYGYSGRLVLRLPRELHKLAARKAERDRVSLNQCLLTAIATWVGADNLYQRLEDRLLDRIVASNREVQTTATKSSLEKAAWTTLHSKKKDKSKRKTLLAGGD
ncbi:MAG: type II toxin-antitoxin system HicB family antitoxin [Deltaproteobacteria bacterium]|nr:type II toxin-antitoxin system HicB family antitoxin [Deltaproteobacteria bacterium]